MTAWTMWASLSVSLPVPKGHVIVGFRRRNKHMTSVHQMIRIVTNIFNILVSLLLFAGRAVEVARG